LQKQVKPVLLKALENCARQPSQVAIVTEAAHAAACLLRMAATDEAGTAGRAEKTSDLAKLLNAEAGAEKQVAPFFYFNKSICSVVERAKLVKL
jgi:hypothetical protein